MGTLAGSVSNVATGQSLEGALVEITGTNRSTYTDREGTFRFSAVPPGRHTVVVTYTGLDAQRHIVDVSSGTTSRLTVLLNAEIYRMGEFRVEGEREGNAAAIAQQRAAPNLKNILATDALGTISDANVGNLLQRLASISADFSSGDVTYVRVRGIDPNLNAVTVDGTRMANEDLISTRRQFRFNQFSVSNIGKVEVTKAPTPEMDADSIGGSINLVSKSAFDSKAGRQAGVSMGFYYRFKDRPDEGDFDFNLQKRQLSTKLQPTASVFYSDVLGAKKNIGVRFDANFNPRYAGRDTAQSQYQATTSKPAYTWQYRVGEGTRHTRTIAGIGARLDFKQSERSSYYVSAKFNYLHHTNELNDINFQTSQSIATVDSAGQLTGTGTILPNYTDTVTEARATNNTFVQLLFNVPEKVYAASRQLSVGGRHELDRWSIDHNINVSDAVSDIPTGLFGGYLTAEMRNVGWRIDRTRSNTLPDVTQTAGPDWYNLDNFKSLSSRMDDVREGKDTITGAQINAKRSFETRHPVSLKLGLRYRSQFRDNQLTRRTLTYLGPDRVLGVNPATGIDDGSLLRFLDSDYNYGPFEGRYRPFQFPKVRTVRETVMTNPEWFSENFYTTVVTTLQNDKQVRETVTAGYVQASVRINRLTVLTGVRTERTEVKGTGPRRADSLAPNPGNETREQARARAFRDWGAREEREGDYQNHFPGIHGTYAVTKNLLVRASWTTGIGRPNFAELIPNTTINLPAQSISVTNPSLRPQFSRNYDLTAEYYIQPAGLVSAGVFRKDIRNFIGRRSEIVPDGPDNGFDGDYVGYTISRNVNEGAAKMQGIELSYQQQFTFLPGWMRHLGGYANFTYLKVEGSQDDAGLLGRRELGGFVPRTGNLGVSYVSGKVSVRLQGNHRGRSAEASATNPATTVVRSTYRTVNLNQYRPTAWVQANVSAWR